MKEENEGFRNKDQFAVRGHFIGNGVDGKVRPSVLAVTGATNMDRMETQYTIRNSYARTQIHEKKKK